MCQFIHDCRQLSDTLPTISSSDDHLHQISSRSVLPNNGTRVGTLLSSDALVVEEYLHYGNQQAGGADQSSGDGESHDVLRSIGCWPEKGTVY